jgi:phosphoserine aminotransferase
MTPPTAAAKPNAAPSLAPALGRTFNFSAGPGVMPDEVLRQIQAEVWDCRNSGVGILEHSHRAPVYDAILAEAEADCRAVGGKIRIKGN